MSTRTLLLFISGIVIVLSAAPADAARRQASLSLGPLFRDHAVLQRDRPIAVWGHAGPGDDIAITLGGREVTARADASGGWAATLPAMSAGGPHTLQVHTGSGATQAVSDILVGDVFLCSGQSNMEFSLADSAGGAAAARGAANDRIRLLTVAHAGKPEPAAAFDTAPDWLIAAPDSVRTFSAVCYFFGREIQETRDVPVGLVNASWSGSAIEPWMSDAGSRGIGGFDARLDLLRLFARDEDGANQSFGRMWEDWWRQHGPSAGEPWKPEDSGPWTDVPGFRNWKTWDVPELANHDGMVWYRRAFSLTPAQAAGAATLSLGGIDEVDETWVNGHVVRNTFGWGTPRTYRLPAGTLRAGENVLVVNVLSTWDAGGMMGPADALALTLDDGTRVSLAGEWRYRPVPIDTGRPPRAPWETVAGLTTLYNGMIAPIGPFGLRGVLWYQGESNTDEPAAYEKLLAGLMASWRSQFGTDLPFLVVQLPNFGDVPTKPVESGWAGVREAQRRAVAADAHAGLAVTIDIGEPGELHPGNKRGVARRLARAARHVIYGQAIAPSGPIPLSVQRDAANIVVSFDDVDGALVTYSSNIAIGFELCDAGPDTCRFVPGTADGTRVVLPVPESPAWTPARVRFCWGASPICNLSDGSGLPAGPFELPIE